jgi:hypothetical protein
METMYEMTLMPKILNESEAIDRESRVAKRYVLRVRDLPKEQKPRERLLTEGPSYLLMVRRKKECLK